MKKLTLNLPKLITKRNLLIALGAVLFVSVIAYGMVRAEQLEAAQAAETARLEADAKRTAAANRAYVDSLEAQVEAGKQAVAERQAVCNWVVSLQKTYRYTVPPLCQTR